VATKLFNYQNEAYFGGGKVASQIQVKYSKPHELFISLFKSAYQYYSKDKKFYSFDGKNFIPYNRDVTPHIIVEKLDIQEKTISGAKIIARKEIYHEIRFKVRYTIDYKTTVVNKDFEVQMYTVLLPIEILDERRIWAMLYREARSVKDIAEQEGFEVFPHYYKARKSKHNKAMIIFVRKVDLEKIDKEIMNVLKQDRDYLNKELEEIEDLIKELDSMESTKKKEVNKAEESINVEVKLTEKDIEKFIAKQGLVKTRIITFDLPTEYKGAKTQYHKNGQGQIQEIKTFANDPTKFRSLRRKFYMILEKSAIRTTMGWILYNTSKLGELNKIIDELNKLSGTSRNIWIIEVYVPKHYVIEQIDRYIYQKKMNIEELKKKLQLQTLKKAEIKRIKKEIEQMEEIIKEVEKFKEQLISAQ